MHSRWTILAILFLARLSMAFQFQSIAALAPFISDTLGIGLADIGLLIGLYLAPGIVVSIPGSTIAARLGEKRIVVLGMGLMLIGGLMIGAGTGWPVLAAGRVLAGIGGVVVNIVLTKLLVDWFVGREIATAMAIFINSWPLGIALALLLLPPAAAGGGLTLAWAVGLGLIAAGLALFALLYQPPETPTATAAPLRKQALPLAPLGLAGLVWALYNTALAMMFSFGALLLIERGWSVPAASSTTSAFMIVLSLSLPFGGLLADRTGQRDPIIGLSLLSFAVLLPLALFGPGWAVATLFVVTGAVFGLAGGPIMALPASVLAPETRAFGMGVFFTIYYGIMMIAPSIGGWLADRNGTAAAAILFGCLASAAALAALLAFRRLARETRPA